MEEQIKTLFEKGYTIDMVCQSTGLSKYKVVKIKASLGLVKKKPSDSEVRTVDVVKETKPVKVLSETEKQAIQELYMAGRGVSYITRQLKTSPKLTKDFCDTLNRPKRGEAGYIFKSSKQV